MGGGLKGEESSKREENTIIKGKTSERDRNRRERMIIHGNDKKSDNNKYICISKLFYYIYS